MSYTLRHHKAEINKLTWYRAFVTFITAGFPTRDSTVPLMMALEAGGADIIELGMPFSDPIGDGPTIQRSNTVSSSHHPTLPYGDEE